MIPAPGTERLKAVLDTNICIAAFAYPEGRNAAVWNAAVDGRYELVVSPAIIRETAKVLRGDFAWREDRVQKAIRVGCHQNICCHSDRGRSGLPPHAWPAVDHPSAGVLCRADPSRWKAII
jgi:hypothetical protein